MTMRSLFLLASFLAAAAAFSPSHYRATTKDGTSQLEMVSRRDALVGIFAAGLLIPESARAFSQQLDDFAYEPQQQATDGKWDLNSVFVVSAGLLYHTHARIILFLR